MDDALSILGWSLLGIWLIILAPSTYALLTRSLARQTAGLAVPERWPTVSVIVAARDEEARIATSLNALLDSDYEDLEILAVDDRSCDRTGDIMDRLAQQDPRLQVLHITHLSDGWLGKNHALHVASGEARGEFLLFTDGDIVFAPDVIRLALNYAVRRDIDHLCLMPNMICGGYLENALVTFFGLLFAISIQPGLARTPVKQAYVGVGAFNLVRRSVYDRIGGHKPIRFDVLDDVKLGKSIKRAGFRQDLLFGGERLCVKWQDSAWGVIRGLEKNGFASFDYSLPKLVIVSWILGTLLFGPYIGLALLDEEFGWGFVASAGLIHLFYGVFGSSFGSSWRVVPVLPAAALCILFAFWRSAWITLRQHGVRWRKTFYPLDALRKGLYR